jgi:OmpA-OmpF porin, OOP family
MSAFSEKWAQLTVLAKILVVSVPTAGLLYGAYTQKPEWFNPVLGTASVAVSGIETKDANFNASNETLTTTYPYTAAQVKAEHAGTWRELSLAWNGNIGMINANHGKVTAPGSFMQKAGIDLSIERQDDYGVMQAKLLEFAQAFKNGDADPSVGVHSVTIMGDAGASFLAGLEGPLKKLDLHARIIGATGRSLGEDKCMGRPEWADSPKAAKGGLIAAVLRDGDWNICMSWAQTNGLKVNPDEKTWDPDALNFFGTSSFTDADKAYISGYCEDRPIVRDGKRTGDTKHVCVEGTATWTPGDVNVVQNKGGVVSLLSTKENGAQMFATIIVIDEWAKANPATTTNFLKASLDGSTEVATDRAALRRASGWSAEVWGEQDTEYWFKYYNGFVETVKNTDGRQVRLGGSQALGLASNLQYFLPLGNSVYDRVYRTFGDLSRKLYPDIMPAYPTDVVDTSFLEKIRDSVGSQVGTGAVFGQFSGSERTEVANRSYSIQFGQGSATILQSSYSDLGQILNNVTVSSNLAIMVEGYTSSEGDSEANQRLSEARAQAVKAWLMKNAPAGLITNARVRSSGMGESNLVMTTAGTEDRAASRRVLIRLLSE